MTRVAGSVAYLALVATRGLLEDSIHHLGAPLRWLDDAWRTFGAALVGELPADVHRPAVDLLRAVAPEP